MKPSDDHKWPTSPEQHMWGPWLVKEQRRGVQPPTEYRTCNDPTCGAFETRVKKESPQ